jgi:hypothetical protein
MEGEMDGNGNGRSFNIKDCALSAIATGVRAHNLRELRDHMLRIHPGSIYYHFWGGLLRPRFDEREFNNDFALWLHEAHGLHDETLAERLAVVDPSEYADIEQLRFQLIDIMSDRLDESEKLRLTHADKPFEFIRSQIVVFDTGFRISSPEDLARTARSMTPSSYFFHFIDSRRRTPGRGNDFCEWLSNYGPEYSRLCDKLREIDPYFISLAELKNSILATFDDYFS